MKYIAFNYSRLTHKDSRAYKGTELAQGHTVRSWRIWTKTQAFSVLRSFPLFLFRILFDSLQANVHII